MTGGRVESYRLRFFKVPSKGSAGGESAKYSVIEKVEIPANRFRVNLVNLEPNQVYRAQIHAVVGIGDEAHVLKGHKASLKLYTQQRDSKGMTDLKCNLIDVHNLFFLYLFIAGEC